MKKIDLGILDNADDDIIEKLPPFSSDEETRKRVLSMSEKKFDELMNEKNKGNVSEYAESVSGVEKYRRPVWHKALGVAAAVALIAGGIGTAAVIKNKSPKSSDSMLAALTTEEQNIAATDTAATTDAVSVQAAAPVIDISNDEVRFMAAAYAPYLLDISADQQQKLAAAINSDSWTPCDVNAPLPDGEAFNMYVYNNGAPYSLTLYGDNTVKLEGMGEATRWYVPAETAKAITEAANPAAYENAISDHLTWCDISSINVNDIWKNTRAGAKECDMTDKKDIFYKMNNTLDYFDRASGVIKRGGFELSGYGSMAVSEFQVDLNTAKAYECEENYYGFSTHLTSLDESVTKDDTAIISSQDGEYCYTAGISKDTYSKIPGVVHRIDTPTVPFEELRPKDDSFNEYDNWNSRRQMLGGIAVDCIENYRMAVDYLQDFDKWDIIGTQEVLGRNCVRIEGTYDVEYDAVKKFELYVDIETGVTVWMNGYDSEGRLKRFTVVENLKFDDEAEPVKTPDFTGLEEKQIVPHYGDGAPVSTDGNGIPQEATDTSPVTDPPADNN
ncbi:MAG: hypothetical protein IKO47_09145 [Ruminococcus sp.]|nr:hypothetical protein [Ruminococcus sp.]